MELQREIFDPDKRVNQLNYKLSIAILVLQVLALGFVAYYVVNFLNYRHSTLVSLLESMRIPLLLLGLLSALYTMDGLTVIVSRRSSGLNVFAAIVQGAFLIAFSRPLVRLIEPVFFQPETFINMYCEGWFFPSMYVSLGLLILTVVVNLIDVLFMSIDLKREKKSGETLQQTNISEKSL